MAECKIYLFGESITRNSDSSGSNTGLIYTTESWGNADSTGRQSGFVPNEPARSSVVNTAIAQNNIVAYVVANVLTSRVNSTNNTPPQYNFTTDIEGNGIQDVANAWINTLKVGNFLVDSEVTESKIASNAVTTAKIADYVASSNPETGISTAKIQDSAVTTAKIADSAVTTDKLANSTGTQDGIITSKIADSAVTTAKIANSAITIDKIANSAVTIDKIQDGAVTVAKIATYAINNDKVATNAGIESSKINFSGGISGIGGLNMWSIVQSGSYLEFRYNGTWKFRISTSGDVVTP